MNLRIERRIMALARAVCETIEGSMRRNNFGIRKMGTVCVLGCVLAFIATGRVCAGNWTIVDELQEALLGDLGVDGFGLAAEFGYTDYSAVPVEGSIDETTRSYTFDAVAGSSYLGNTLTITGSGVYDANRGLYLTTSQVIWEPVHSQPPALSPSHRCPVTTRRKLPRPKSTGQQ